LCGFVLQSTLDTFPPDGHMMNNNRKFPTLCGDTFKLSNPIFSRTFHRSIFQNIPVARHYVQSKNIRMPTKSDCNCAAPVCFANDGTEKDFMRLAGCTHTIHYRCLDWWYEDRKRSEQTGRILPCGCEASFCQFLRFVWEASFFPRPYSG
jgi:hypothetical protein